jgi:hypothetical protein
VPLNTRQQDIVEYLKNNVQKFGLFDKTAGANGSHYMTENPFNSQGMNCGNCVFYAKNACGIVKGNINPNAICKFWVIEESKLTTTRKFLLNKALFGN